MLESPPNRHATRTCTPGPPGDPVGQPGEDWFWCYEEEVVFAGHGVLGEALPRAPSRPGATPSGPSCARSTTSPPVAADAATACRERRGRLCRSPLSAGGGTGGAARALGADRTSPSGEADGRRQPPIGRLPRCESRSVVGADRGRPAGASSASSLPRWTARLTSRSVVQFDGEFHMEHLSVDVGACLRSPGGRI